MAVVELELTCPFASPCHPAAEGPSVVCGVIKAENERHPIAQQIDPVVGGRRSSATIVAYCAGKGIPSDTERHEHDPTAEPGSYTCYTDCPVFRDDRDRQERAKHEGVGAPLIASGVERVEH